MKKITFIALFAMMSVMLLAFTACGNQKITEKETDNVNSHVATDKQIEQKINAETETTINTSIYSWDRELFDKNPTDVLSQLSDYKPTRIYQGLYPVDLKEPSATEKMVKAVAAEGIEVVYLTGDPDWEDPVVVEQWTVDLLTAYNSQVSKEAQIHSICFDAEFYVHEGWDDAEHFKAYAKMMKEVIDYAHEKDLKVIICAPYWLTDYSAEVYADLIASVDELSCTIYMVGQEEEKLKPIYQMCKDGNTSFEIVLETQPVNEEYGVYEYNTYACNGGKTAVLAAAKRLQVKYSDISVGLHSLKYLMELQ